jgi:hypothetical protein
VISVETEKNISFTLCLNNIFGALRKNYRARGEGGRYREFTLTKGFGEFLV